MLKVCPHCKAEFDTAYKSISYCTNMCRDAAKAEEYKARWAAKKPKVSKVTDFQRFSLKGSGKALKDM